MRDCSATGCSAPVEQQWQRKGQTRTAEAGMVATAAAGLAAAALPPQAHQLRQHRQQALRWRSGQQLLTAARGQHLVGLLPGREWRQQAGEVLLLLVPDDTYARLSTPTMSLLHSHASPAGPPQTPAGTGADRSAISGGAVAHDSGLSCSVHPDESAPRPVARASARHSCPVAPGPRRRAGRHGHTSYGTACWPASYLCSHPAWHEGCQRWPRSWRMGCGPAVGQLGFQRVCAQGCWTSQVRPSAPCQRRAHQEIPPACAGRPRGQGAQRAGPRSSWRVQQKTDRQAVRWPAAYNERT